MCCWLKEEKLSFEGSRNDIDEYQKQKFLER